MNDFLPLLVAYFTVLQNKFHSIHTGSKWPEFWYLHWVFGEIYAIFGDDAIDDIRERAGQLKIEIPNSLSATLEKVKIKELEVIPSIPESAKIVYNDLVFMQKMLQFWVEECEKEKDIVTQNMLADFQAEIGKFIWKFDMSK